MPHTIELDDDVFAALGNEAIPFEETTPNAVLRRLLGLTPGSNGAASEAPSPAKGSGKPAKSRTAAKRSARSSVPGTRARRGTLLPQAEYELPILQALENAGGRAPSREIVDAVGKRLNDRLTATDHEFLRSGEVRWQNRVHFTRLHLIEQGWLKGDVPRGTWEISDAGRERLRAEA